MFSSSLENKTPHSIIFPNELLYHVSPNVFCPTCFVHDVSPSLDKLSARAVKYVFLRNLVYRKGTNVILQAPKGIIWLQMLPFSKKLSTLPPLYKALTLSNRFFLSHLFVHCPLEIILSHGKI